MSYFTIEHFPLRKLPAIPRVVTKSGRPAFLEDDVRHWGYSLNLSVSSLLAVPKEAADLLVQGVRIEKTKFSKSPDDSMPTRRLVCDLIYPLNATARVTIDPPKSAKRGESYARMTLGYYLWRLSQAYHAIYADAQRWGVWGHVIGDLVYETLAIEDNVVTVGVGS